MKKKSAKKPADDALVLEVKRFFEGVSLPEYALASDVGIDLRAYESATLHPLEQKAVRTGIAIKIPEGHVGLIRDRAGIVSKMNVHTAAGTFDPAFRGEVSVMLINFSDDSVLIEKGMRIAQLVIIPVTKVEIKEVKKLDITERYDKSFGSTGMKEIVRMEKQMRLGEEEL
jgi:dUTP pyrophosphatase